MEDISRRKFLGTLATGATIATAGCNGGEESTPEENTPPKGNSSTDDHKTSKDDGKDEKETDSDEEETETNRPANYRWDMISGNNEELRSNLGQYIEGNVGPVVTDHPAFEYSTETEIDDHKVDFEALKLFRDSQFDILKQNGTKGIPWEHYVEAFVNDSLEEDAKTSRFMRYDTDDPHNYTSDAWLNAGSFEQSLDLAHGLIASMVPLEEGRIAEQGTILREAYERHQDYEAPLAWETNMGTGTGYDDKITGLMYTPEDDKVRAFDSAAGDMVRTRESRRWHSEIQEWPIFNENNERFHPLLFHTDEWNRQNPGFMAAKDEAVATIFGIGADTAVGYDTDIEESEGPGGLINNLTITTGGTKQLTRTLLEYNELEDDAADFSDIRDLANFAVGNYFQDPSINGVIDTVDPEEDNGYDEYFGGGFGFYEVEDESIVQEVRQDRNGEYDNFGQVYDELDNPA